MDAANPTASKAVEPRLAAEHISKRFGSTRALHDVALRVERGEVLAIVGENGAGKSTLMKILSGALRPDQGRMSIDGRPYTPRGTAHARKRGIGMIYQELALAPHLTVAQNIMLGIEPTVGPFLRHKLLRARAAAAMRALGRDDLSLDVRAERLSIADQQIVEIARAVASNCRILILDEPTSSLAAPDVRRLFRLIRTLAAAGTSVIYVSHFLEEVREISDRFMVLRDGVGAGAGRSATTAPASIAALMIGRAVGELYPRTARPLGETALEFSGLRGAPLPINATLSVRRGEIVGIAGIVGAGRTELLRTVFGLAPLRAGDLRIFSNRDKIGTPRRRWNAGAGFLCEDRKREGLAQTLAIADNIMLPRLPSMRPITRSAQRRAVQPQLSELMIKCRSASQPVSQLSGGNQQKVALARLLYTRAELLLLDEPTRGIDVASKSQIYALLDRLAAGDPARGIAPKAILIVSSYVPELLGICDRIAVMHRGMLGAARPVGEWDEHQIMLAATGAAPATR